MSSIADDWDMTRNKLVLDRNGSLVNLKFRLTDIGSPNYLKKHQIS